MTVTATKKQLGDKRYMVSFNIKEGLKFMRDQFLIAGNRRMADKHILDEMETKGIAPEGVVNALTKSAGIVQDERLINDLTDSKLHRKHGMPGIKFRCANAERSPAEWTTYRQLREQSETMSVRHSTPFCFVDNSMSGAQPTDPPMFSGHSGRGSTLCSDPSGHR